jgi:tryptophan halogenase
MRKQGWNRNVVAIGLSSGFLEPLESTSIHLIQSSIARLVQFFPDSGFHPLEVAEYNRQSRFEYERIRDFVILHYKANQRDDSEFWKQCAAMPVPDSLQHKIDLFQARGRVVRFDNELFAETGWLQVMHGQNLKPQGYDPLADLLPVEEAEKYLESIRDVIGQCVQHMPSHADYIAQHCAAPRQPMPK